MPGSYWPGPGAAMMLSPTSRNVSRVVMDKNGAYPSIVYKKKQRQQQKNNITVDKLNFSNYYVSLFQRSQHEG